MYIVYLLKPYINFGSYRNYNFISYENLLFSEKRNNQNEINNASTKIALFGIQFTIA